MFHCDLSSSIWQKVLTRLRFSDYAFKYLASLYVFLTRTNPKLKTTLLGWFLKQSSFSVDRKGRIALKSLQPD